MGEMQVYVHSTQMLIAGSRTFATEAKIEVHLNSEKRDLSIKQ